MLKRAQSTEFASHIPETITPLTQQRFELLRLCRCAEIQIMCRTAYPASAKICPNSTAAEGTADMSICPDFRACTPCALCCIPCAARTLRSFSLWSDTSYLRLLPDSAAIFRCYLLLYSTFYNMRKYTPSVFPAHQPGTGRKCQNFMRSPRILPFHYSIRTNCT